MGRVLGYGWVGEHLSGHIGRHHDMAAVLRSAGHQSIENWILIELGGRKSIVHLFAFGI